MYEFLFNYIDEIEEKDFEIENEENIIENDLKLNENVNEILIEELYFSQKNEGIETNKKEFLEGEYNKNQIERNLLYKESLEKDNNFLNLTNFTKEIIFEIINENIKEEIKEPIEKISEEKMSLNEKISEKEKISEIEVSQKLSILEKRSENKENILIEEKLQNYEKKNSLEKDKLHHNISNTSEDVKELKLFSDSEDNKENNENLKYKKSQFSKSNYYEEDKNSINLEQFEIELNTKSNKNFTPFSESSPIKKFPSRKSLDKKSSENEIEEVNLDEEIKKDDSDISSNLIQKPEENQFVSEKEFLQMTIKKMNIDDLGNERWFFNYKANVWKPFLLKVQLYLETAYQNNVFKIKYGNSLIDFNESKMYLNEKKTRGIKIIKEIDNEVPLYRDLKFSKEILIDYNCNKSEYFNISLFSFSEILPFFKLNHLEKESYEIYFSLFMLDNAFQKSLQKEYFYYFKNEHTDLMKNVRNFDFQLIKEILQKDFNNNPSLRIYFHFIAKLTPSNYADIITKMYTSEEELYTLITKMLNNQTKENLRKYNYLLFFVLLLMHVIKKYSEELINQNKNREILVYKWIEVTKSDRFHKIISRFQVGNFIKTKNFLSCTRKQDYIELLSGKNIVLFEISTYNSQISYNTMKHAEFYQKSVFPSEKEVIFNPFNVFEITKITAKNTLVIINLKNTNNFFHEKNTYHLPKNVQHNLGIYRYKYDSIKVYEKVIAIYDWEMLKIKTYRFPNLQFLMLSSMTIGKEEISILSSNFNRMKQIRTLNLSLNSLENEGAIILSENLSELNYLQTLNLAKNNIKQEGAKAIGNVLQNLSLLQNLCLQQNDIKDEGAIVIAKNLKNLKYLIKLNLGENDICEAGGYCIMENLSKLKYLQCFDFQDNLIKEKAGILFAKMMQTMFNLKKIYLRNNGIGNKGLIAISNTLSLSNEKLVILNLAGNSIEDEGIYKFVEIFEKLPSLEKLNLSYNKIGNLGVKEIGKNIEILENLKELYLSCNKFEDESVLELVTNVKKIKNLLTFDIGYNNLMFNVIKNVREILTDFFETNLLFERKIHKLFKKKFKSPEVIETIFEKNPLDIKELILNDKAIADEQIFDLSKHFDQKLNIKYIDLRKNFISDYGIKTIAKHFEKLTNLEFLYLGNNKITDIGVVDLFSSLKKLKYICELDLSDNLIECQGVIEISNFIDKFEKLNMINLSFNIFKDKALFQLVEKLSHLKSLKKVFVFSYKTSENIEQIVRKKLSNVKHIEI